MITYRKIYELASQISFLVTLKKMYDQGESWVFSTRRWLRKTMRNNFGLTPISIPDKKMCIVCVKRTVYVDAAIANINSLHFYNPNYMCEVYCDNVCFKHLRSHLNQLDYPAKVKCINLYKKAEGPWQKYKYQTIVKISPENGFLVDADSRWFAEPKVKSSDVMFLCPAYVVSTHPQESVLIDSLFRGMRLSNQVHFATGFLSIPPQFATKKLWSTIWDIFEKINKLETDDELLRLKDEIALNVGIQLCVPKSQISVLKDADGPWDKRILLSYYYGCLNRIIE